MKYTSCTHLFGLLMALMFAMTFAQDNSNKYRIKGDYLDVPVRSGYRIMGDDKDGFLEDGIIVKTKGTGYVDQRYRNRRFENQPVVSQASHHKYFYSPQPAPSSMMMYPKYAVPEIIYGRREW